jgi:hypothetical protein
MVAAVRVSRSGLRIGKILEEAASLRKRAAPFARRNDFEDSHLTLEGNSQNVARPDRLCRIVDALRIDPYIALGDEPRRRRTSLHHPREP